MRMDTIKSLAVITLSLTVLTIIVNFSNYTTCIKKWTDSKYSVLAGCKVNVNGVYIPESNVHVIKWEYAE